MSWSLRPSAPMVPLPNSGSSVGVSFILATISRGALYSVCPIAVFTRATSSGEAEASLLASAWG